MSVSGSHSRKALSRFLPVPVFLFSIALSQPASARLMNGILNYRGSATENLLPQKLSGTGLYTDIASKSRAFTDGIVAYDVNTPLWSDGSHKDRFVSVPAGTKIVPTDSDQYNFPNKTVFVKNFAMDTIAGDDNSMILIETRFLVVHNSGKLDDTVSGITYAWNRNQTDAFLVSPSDGAALIIPVKGGPGAGKRWNYPKRSQCATCHGGRGVLGFLTPQLNRPAKATLSINQLADLFSKAVLSKNPLTANPNSVRWAAIDNATASLESRSRSYFAANCSHCHGTRNNFTNLPHNFDFFNTHMEVVVDSNSDFMTTGYMNQPSRTGGTMPMLLYPGHADSSEILQRMLTRTTLEAPLEDLYSQMPYLATYVPDSAAVRVIADWTCQAGGRPTGTACKLPTVAQPAAPTGISARSHGSTLGQAGLSAAIQGGFLQVRLPGLAAEVSVMPVLSDAHGKRIALRPAGAGRYAVPEGLTSGTYFLRWQGRSITVIAGI